MNRAPRRSGHLRRAAVVVALAATLTNAGAVTCSVSALPVVFGVYNPLSALSTVSTGSVTVTCQPVLVAILQSYTLSLSTGGAGSYASRRLASGANTLQYQLYSNPGYSTVWGNGSGGSSTVASSFLLAVLVPVSATHIVYARMPALQSSAVAGAYSDTIMVTVTY